MSVNDEGHHQFQAKQLECGIQILLHTVANTVTRDERLNRLTIRHK